MSANMRIISVVLLAALVFWGYLMVTSDSPETGPPEESGFAPIVTSGHGAMELKSSKDCKECHPAIYAEWEESQHENAWLNPEPRRKELSDNFRNKDCIPCHAPRPLLEVGFGKRALERETRREDGVNCFTCHKFNNVHVAAHDLSPAAAGAPCNPVTWKSVSEVMLCTPCHDQHKVEQDWLRSRFAVKDSPEYKDCNDCHMPVTDGPGTVGGTRKTHRHHGFKGGHDAAMVRSAGIMRATRVDAANPLGKVVADLTARSWKPDNDPGLKRGVFIEVKNTGTGHNFPADERHRAVDLYARWRPKSGAPGEAVRLTRFRNPYRHEFELTNPFKNIPGKPLAGNVSWNGRDVSLTQVRILPEFNPDRKVFYVESTQLHAGESRFLWFEMPEWGSGSLELVLYYKLQPYMSNEDAIRVTSTTLEF